MDTGESSRALGHNNKKSYIISNENCCVYGCKSIRKKNPTLMYHGFPNLGQKIKEEDGFGQLQLQDRRKLWESRLKIGKKVTKSMKVCSLHFSDDDYEQSGWSSVKSLKSTAVPNKNLPVVTHQHMRKQSEFSESQKREIYNRRNKQRQGKQQHNSAEDLTNAEVNLLLGQTSRDVGIQVVEEELCSVGIQVNSSDLYF